MPSKVTKVAIFFNSNAQIKAKTENAKLEKVLFALVSGDVL